MDPAEAIALVGGRCWLSHETAAAAWGLAVLDSPSPHVTVERNRSRARARGVVVRRQALGPADTAMQGSLPLLSVARTVRDLARERSHEAALTVADSALHLGLISRQDLVGQLTPGRPWSAALRRVIDECDPKTESPLESLARSLFLRHGLHPETQRSIDTSIGLLRVDFVIGQLVIELDGKAYHTGEAAFSRDRRRDAALALCGYRVLRFTWEDITVRPEETVATVVAVLASMGEPHTA